MAKIKIRHYFQKSDMSSYEFEWADTYYSIDEAIEDIDQYGSGDIFILSIFHNYEVTKEDIIDYVMPKLSDIYIEIYHMDYKGVAEIKLFF